MIKKFSLLTILLVFLSAQLWSQSPQLMNYQAVVRNSAGTPLAGGTVVSVKFVIHNGASNGTVVYQEDASDTTNQFGIITNAIGTNASLASVQWSSGAKWLQVEIDPTGGTNYTDMGTTQLISVPYALFAANSESGPTGATGAQGSQGGAGPQGATGTQGATGPQGAPGPQGSTGVAGPAGATGPSGPNGTAGPSGNNGTNGAAGANGVTGATGPTGPSGNAGAAGSNGATGATGPSGNDGSNGVTGATGPSGNDGSNGVTGATGPSGNDGAAGVAGPTGTAGSDGATGATGPSGNDGTNGVTGATGPSGNDGAAGVAGPTGTAGSDGATGATGPSGNDGTNGVTGATGPSGNDGAAGIAGPTGTAGSDGATGATGPSGNDGSNGVTGATGPSGNDGAAGVAGPTGTAGSDGATGATGPSGNDGSNGVTGATGPSGNDGAAGVAGPTGTAGSDGATGATGPSGNDGTNGVTGATGPSGNDGAAGVAGPTGTAGSNGATGATGPSGNDGSNGVTGATGPSGNDGSSGVTGATGPSGNDGAAGVAGPTGTAGSDGVTGATGPSGNDGSSGVTGATGPSGNDGAAGVAGPTGTAGSDGATGATGPSGNDGSNGITGVTGPSGNDGAAGVAGATGTAGSDGATGATGPSGNDGSSGVTGATGPSGNDGAAGVAGPTGTAGSDGATGATGPSGNDGTNGVTGATGPSGNDGAAGVAGSTGSTGNDGVTGATGPSGNDGATGATGASGSNGNDGLAGATGATGPSGNEGVTGITGPTGTGATGSTGATGPLGTAGGDLSGSYPDPTVSGLQNNPVSSTTPALNNLLYWNGSSWAPGNGNGIFWTITGNSSTNPPTNFIGTTDAEAFVIKTDNTEAMRVTSSGDVGIGITTPVALLQVNNSSTTTLGNGAVDFFQPNLAAGNSEYLKIGVGLSTDNEADIAFYNAGAGSSANYLGIGFYNTAVVAAFTAGGNVGIATTTPNAKLDIDGSEMINGGLTNTSARPAVSGGTLANGELRGYSSNGATYDDGFLRLSAGGGTTAGAKTYIDLSGYETSASNDMYENIVFGTAGAERMRILYTGNVGIGTSTPATTTEISAAKNDLLKITSTIGNTGNTSLIDFLTYGGTGVGARIGAIDAGGYDASIVFQTNNSGTANGTTTNEVMRITNTGYVGIGTTTPGYPLQIVGSVNLQGSLTYGRLSSTQENVSVTSGYNINPSIYVSNDVVAGGGFYAFSDRRIKKEIEPVSTLKALEQIKSVEPVSYGYIDTIYRANHRTLGFIAQDVEKVIPEAVTKIVDFIPNVLAQAEICNDGGQTIIDFNGAKTVNVKDELKTYAQSGLQTTYTVTGKINDAVYVISGDNIITQNVFVFGTKVNDFRSVDYNKVFTVGIAAIQELAQKVETLEKQNSDLTQKVSALTSDSKDIQLLHKQLDALKTLMEQNGIRVDK